MNPKKVLTTAGLIVALGGVVANSVAFSVKDRQHEEQMAELRNEMEEVNGQTRTELRALINETRENLEELVANSVADLQGTIATLREDYENSADALAQADELLKTNLTNGMVVVMSNLNTLSDLLSESVANLSNNDSVLNSLIESVYRQLLGNIAVVNSDLLELEQASTEKDTELANLIATNGGLITGLRNDLEEVKDTYATLEYVDTCVANLNTRLDNLQIDLDTKIGLLREELKNDYNTLINDLKILVTLGKIGEVPVTEFAGLVELTARMAAAEGEIAKHKIEVENFNGEVARTAKGTYCNELTKVYVEFKNNLIPDWEDRAEKAFSSTFNFWGREIKYVDWQSQQIINGFVNNLNDMHGTEMYYLLNEGISRITIATDVTDANKEFVEYKTRLNNFILEAEFVVFRRNAYLAANEGLTAVTEEQKTIFLNDIMGTEWDGEHFAEISKGTHISKDQTDYFNYMCELVSARKQAGLNYNTITKMRNDMLTMAGEQYADFTELVDELKTDIDAYIAFDDVRSYRNNTKELETVEEVNNVLNEYCNTLAVYQVVIDQYRDILVKKDSNLEFIGNATELAGDDDAINAFKDENNALIKVSHFKEVLNPEGDKTNYVVDDISEAVAKVVEELNFAGAKAEALVNLRAIANEYRNELTSSELSDDAKAAFNAELDKLTTFENYKTNISSVKQGDYTSLELQVEKTQEMVDCLRGLEPIQIELESTLKDLRQKVADLPETTEAEAKFLADAINQLEANTECYTETGIKEGWGPEVAEGVRATADPTLDALINLVDAIRDEHAAVAKYNSDIKEHHANFASLWAKNDHENANGDGATVIAEYTEKIDEIYAEFDGGARAITGEPKEIKSDDTNEQIMEKVAEFTGTLDSSTSLAAKYAEYKEKMTNDVETPMTEKYAELEAQYLAKLVAEAKKSVQFFTKLGIEQAGEDTDKINTLNSLQMVWLEVLDNAAKSKDVPTILDAAYAAFQAVGVTFYSYTTIEIVDEDGEPADLTGVTLTLKSASGTVKDPEADGTYKCKQGTKYVLTLEGLDPSYEVEYEVAKATKADVYATARTVKVKLSLIN